MDGLGTTNSRLVQNNESIPVLSISKDLKGKPFCNIFFAYHSYSHRILYLLHPEKPCIN